MAKKITYCLVDDLSIPLLFSLGACDQLNDELGDVDAFIDLFRAEESPEEREIREEIERGMTPEEQQAKELSKPKFKLDDVLPFAFTTLAREGQRYLGEAPTLNEEWVKLHASPGDIENMTLALCKALALGMSARHMTEAEEEDLVAKVLQKNAAGATA